MSSIQQLPVELLDHILMLLAGPTIQALCQTCHEFIRLYRDASFWRRKYELDYGKVSWDDLSREFTELLPGNWRQAYYCRWLTRRYSTLMPYIKVNRSMINRGLNEGWLGQSKLSLETRQLLGLWNRQIAFQKLWDRYYGNVDWSSVEPDDETLTFEEAQAEINAELDEKIEKTENNPSLWRINKPIRLHDFTDLNLEAEIIGCNGAPNLSEDLVGMPRGKAEEWISADTIVTPKIITLVIDPYDGTIQSMAGISEFDPSFRGFEYTYATPKNGFTMKEFLLKAKDALERYCYMISLMCRKRYASIDNISVQGFEYRNGRYHMKSYSLGS